MALNQLEKQAIIDREGMSPIYNSGLVGVTIPANRTIDDVIDNARTAEDFYFDKLTSGYAKDTDLTGGTIDAKFNTLTANEYHVTILSSSVLYAGGSSKFGDTFDDKHYFTGSVNITGSTVQSGNNTLIGNTQLTGSVNISGSTTIMGTTVFNNSSTTITGSLLISGSTTQIGNNRLLGTTELTGSISITGSVKGVSSIDFDVTQPVTTNIEGRLTWSDADGTLNLGLKGGNVTLQVGQEEVVRVVNKTGANLLESEYKAVRVRTAAEGGAQGQRLAVVNALANAEVASSTTLGIVTEDIGINQEGFITTFGLVRNVNTTGALQGEDWNDGDTLYLSPTTAGGLTKFQPTSPLHLVVMGYVVYSHSSQGKIFVKVINGYEFGELHDVYINTSTLVGNAKTTGGSTLYRSGSVYTNNQNVRFTETTAILAQVSASLNYANDTAAAAGGVPLGGIYRNGNVIQIRLV